MTKYTKKIKSKIFKILNKTPGTFDSRDDKFHTGIISFLDNIWGLKGLPIVSGDDRYTNAYDEAVKHLVSNDDWSYEETFIDYFKLLEIDEDFTKFLETVVHPEFRIDLSEIELFVAIINDELAIINFTLAVSDYKEGFPIYTLRKTKKNDEIHILENKNTIYSRWT